VTEETEDCQARMDLLEAEVAREITDHLGEEVKLVIQVHQENKVILVTLETGEILESLVQQVHVVYGEGGVTQVVKDQGVSKDQLDSQDHEDLLDLRDQMVCLVHMAQLGKKV
jgi:hypothetical protein